MEVIKIAAGIVLGGVVLGAMFLGLVLLRNRYIAKTFTGRRPC